METILSLGITDKVDNSEYEEAMANFKETVRYEDGRYVVTWPLKEENPQLPENRSLAVGRLQFIQD